MIDQVTVAAWLAKYIAAWKSYDPEAIGSLFSEDARYYYNPFGEPLMGRAAIVASWMEDPDPPGTFDASYEPIAVDGSTAVANGRSRYFSGTPVGAEFDNIFVMRFDEHGQCVEFREWFMKRT